MTEIVAAGDDEKVAFAVADVVTNEGFDPHGPREMLQRTVGELKADYDRVVGQVLAMTENTPAQSNLRLTTIEVGLAFSAEGELGFIAKASVGVEASVTLTFERK